MAEYVGQQLVHLDLRPKRAAFLYATGSAMQFRLAVERASSRWGGLQEPIVPVSPLGRIQPAWKQIVEALQPDVIFDLAGLSAEAKRRVRDQLGLTVQPVTAEDRPSSGAHPLVVDQSPGAAFVATGLGPAEVAGPGLLPSWDTAEHWANSSVTIFGSDDEVASALNQLRAATIIERSTEQCGEVWTSGLMAGFALLWIADSKSLRDATWFWNVRALMPRSLSVASAVLMTPTAARDPRVREELELVMSGRRWSSPDAVLVGLRRSPADLEEIALALGLDVHEGGFKSHFGGRATTDRLSVAIRVDPRAFLLGPRAVGRRSTELATIERPMTTLRAPAGVRWNRPAVGGHVIARWSAPFLDAPRRATTAAVFHPNGTWKYGGLEVETNALPIYQFEVNVPARGDVLTAALRDSGVRFELSQPGKLAAAVLGRVGQPHDLFSGRQMRAVIGALTTPRSKRLAALIAAEAPTISEETASVLADRVGSRLAQVALSAANIASRASVDSGTASRLVERLVALGLCERGLLVPCDRCGLEPFVPMKDTTATGECPACHTSSEYATDDRGRVTLHYRLNALLDRASDQGVVPHLAVLEQLAPDDASSHWVLGAHLFLGDNHLGEVDLLGFDGEQLVCGEVKTSSGGFTPSEVATACRLANVIHSDRIIFGCTSPMTTEAVAHLFAAAPATMRVSVVEDGRVHLAALPEPTVSAPMD